MDAPRIQYCNAGDGLSIAYWTLGDGPALVMQSPLAVSHLGLEWEEDLLREWYIHLSHDHRLVRFDPLGEGLSSRGIESFTLDSAVSQIGAVVDRLQLARFDLVGFGTESIAVAAYAALHLERVQQAVLVGSAVRGSDFIDVPQMRAVIGLLDTDYQLFTETVAHMLLGGWGRGDAAHRFAKHMQESRTVDDHRALLRDIRDWDVTDLAPRVAARTLIVHNRKRPVASSRELASLIPDSRLVQVTGRHIFERQEAGT